MDDSEDTLTYSVVVNHEEQYSIWPAHKALPAGWQNVGKTGKKVRSFMATTGVRLS
jgi:MbtH protein